MRRRNIAAGIGLIACSLVYGYLSWLLPERSLPNTPGPSFFPLVVTVILFVLSVALLFQGLVAAPDAGEAAEGGNAGEGTTDRAGWRMSVTALGALFVYVVFLPILGFILATLPLFAALMVLYGERRPIVVMAGAVLATTVLYVLFRHGFGVFLPRGLLAGIVA